VEQVIENTEKQEAIAVPGPTDKWERLMQIAVERGGGAEQFAMLVEAMTKARREDARLQFEAALGRFREHIPVVHKTKRVAYKNKDGTETAYWHAELDKAAKQIAVELKKEGIIHTWRPSEGENGRTIMTCVFRHTASGHVEDMATLGGPPDTSGGKNNVQAIGSTTSYLERYTLLASAGIVAEGMDNDGRNPEEATLSYKPVPEEVVKKRTNQIMAAGNDTALKTAFQEALQEAKATGDEPAQTLYSKAKNDRYRELHPRKEGQ
jgi:hypothetical protein